MRSVLLALVLVAGCGGSSVQTGGSNQTRGQSPWTGTYLGTCYISFQDVGPGSLRVQPDGKGVLSIRTKRGEPEDYLVFVEDSGSFVGNWYGQPANGTTVKGTLELQGKDLTAAMDVKYRITPGLVLRAKKQ